MVTEKISVYSSSGVVGQVYNSLIKRYVANVFFGRSKSIFYRMEIASNAGVPYPKMKKQILLKIENKQSSNTEYII